MNTWTALFEAKWDFSRKYFQTYFLDDNVYILIKISLIQIMAWRRPGDKQLSESMMIYWRINLYGTLGLNELNLITHSPTILTHLRWPSARLK